MSDPKGADQKAAKTKEKIRVENFRQALTKKTKKKPKVRCRNRKFAHVKEREGFK